ncbi:uncharacterized protein [Venturia canescens]|uniref:uncharacterized protein n=1 Tax=Venturia canescens TaxID=32260 RepID=UPI001C9D22E6|nr:uncharacterized protein LOC122412976 [Venturia canescens]
MRNIEIKASVQDWETINDKAKELSGSEPTTIRQNDTFFKAEKGRLKLRRFEDGSGELIFYERPDISGPKLSNYRKANLSAEDCKQIGDVLTESNGVLGTVEKTRYLYMIGQSRIHIDRVLNLGTFVEIEVVLREDQTPETGQKISEDLMEKLGIKTTDLISKAYLDLLVAKIQ